MKASKGAILYKKENIIGKTPAEIIDDAVSAKIEEVAAAVASVYKKS